MPIIWALHGLVMKLTLIVLLFISSIALANAHPDNGFWEDNINVETAKNIGIIIINSNDSSVNGCRVFEFELQPIINSRKFNFISAYLSKDKKYAGGFDLAVEMTQDKKYTTAIEMCDLAATQLQFNIGYGKNPESKSYIITFPIKSM